MLSSGWFLPVAVGLVAVGLVGAALVLVFGGDRDRTTGRLGRRLGRYSLAARPREERAAPTSALGSSSVARSAVELADRVSRRTELGTTLSARLESAGLPLRPAEWLVIHALVAVGAGLALLLLTHFSPLAGLIGLVLGALGPLAYLSNREAKRRTQFAASLPDTLQLLAGSLSAGYSLPQAIDVVVRESTPPMSDELGRALVEARLGVPLEDALESTATRMDNVDLSWVVIAIRIQREVGGNLAEILSRVAGTMRERERLRREVGVLSAEGRLSAGILIALPLLLLLYLVLVRPDYISVLVTTPIGLAMSFIGAGLLGIGIVWMRRLIRVQV